MFTSAEIIGVLLGDSLCFSTTLGVGDVAKGNRLVMIIANDAERCAQRRRFQLSLYSKGVFKCDTRKWYRQRSRLHLYESR